MTRNWVEMMTQNLAKKRVREAKEFQLSMEMEIFKFYSASDLTFFAAGSAAAASPASLLLLPPQSAPFCATSALTSSVFGFFVDGSSAFSPLPPPLLSPPQLPPRPPRPPPRPLPRPPPPPPRCLS